LSEGYEKCVVGIYYQLVKQYKQAEEALLKTQLENSSDNIVDAWYYSQKLFNQIENNKVESDFVDHYWLALHKVFLILKKCIALDCPYNPEYLDYVLHGTVMIPKWLQYLRTHHLHLVAEEWQSTFDSYVELLFEFYVDSERKDKALLLLKWASQHTDSLEIAMMTMGLQFQMHDINELLDQKQQCPVWSVVQFNDYRKEHFFQLLGVYTLQEMAYNIQYNLCRKVRDESHWMYNHPIRRKGSDLFIVNGCEDEPERVVFQIEKHNVPISMTRDPATIYALIHAYWGGWGGLNRCHVQEMSLERNTFQEYDVEEDTTHLRKTGEVYYVKDVTLNQTYDPVMW